MKVRADGHGGTLDEHRPYMAPGKTSVILPTAGFWWPAWLQQPAATDGRDEWTVAPQPVEI